MDAAELERTVVDALGARVTRVERLRSLWAGYGELLRVTLEGRGPVIVKHVRPPAALRGDGDPSHARKLRSYDVETEWYRRWAPRTDDACRVPRLLAARAEGGAWVLVLEDLDAAGFARRTSAPSRAELDRCVRWLAALHARFVGATPDGLWPVGTYWHVATRADELARMTDARLREAAPALDARLEACAFRTIVHGDAKEENFCFGDHGVAAVDFQYAGGGCGVKDLAYLLYGRWGTSEEARALDVYFDALRAARADGAAIERAWRALYPLACADFCRFLAGWAPAQWARDGAAQARAREALAAL